MMENILLLTTGVICLVANVCSDANNDVNAATDISRLFLETFDIPWRKSARKARLRAVPSYMRKLYKQQNPETSAFSEVTCIFNIDHNSSSLKRLFLTFDLPNAVKLQAASRVKLRLFKRRSKLRVDKDLYYIHLFQVLSLDNNRSSVEDKIRISSRVVDNQRGEWLTFDVTLQVQKAFDSKSIRFLLDVKPLSLQSKLKPVTIGKLGPKRPMLLVFYQKKFPNNKRKSKPMTLDFFAAGGMSRLPRDVAGASSAGANKFCRRHNLYIDFRALGWEKLIIAPRGYPAYYCRGKCPVMLGQSMNPSPYSVIRNLYKSSTQKNDIPSACCVPTELKPTSILYFNENENIVLKEFPDMSVASCGCR